ncbi:B-cell receptor CD22-like [Mantella aurantiaca]
MKVLLSHFFRSPPRWADRCLAHPPDVRARKHVRSSDVDAKQWSFIFPKSINALKNSDVTIPCTFTAPVNHREVNLIWYIYRSYGYPQVFNSKDPSKVLENYRGRTSLVANGTNSCTLRIKDMTTTEKFYPGISEEINSYQLNSKQNVEVKVTGCSDDGSCKKWTFEFPSFVSALEGSCVDIPCTFTHPEDAKDFNFFWYANKNKIFNNKTQSDVLDEYKGRTFLTGNTENDCSLKINNVGKKEDYYPGINDEINSIQLKYEKVQLTVKENPPEPTITGTENLKDKKTCNISCSVNHTCPSSPPTLTWSVSGHPVMENHEDLDLLGKWRMKSTMTYTASYTNDKTDLEYLPQNVTVSVQSNSNTQEDDNVTLLCSSQANPPVYNYSWYRIDQGRKLLPGNGDKIFVKNTTTGQYKCDANNEMGTGESSVFELNKQLQQNLGGLPDD